jgi:hypothetical protein
MAVRLTPRRALALAALVAAVALTSACGGGSPARAAANDPPLTKYASSSLSFTHPSAWTAYPFRWAGELHFQPLVYLSTQPVRNPCTTRGNVTSCGFPLRRLRPGGVLVVWQVNGIPATGLGPGTRIRVAGRPATFTETRGGACRRIGADRTIEAVVETSRPPAPFVYLTACLRGPGVAKNEHSVRALLASTKLPS